MKVRSPDGQTWRVSRRWVPWRRHLKGSMGLGPSSGHFPGFDDPIAIVLSVLLLVLLIPALVIMAFAIIEILVLLALLPLVVLARIAFGRHWHIEVRRGFKPWSEESAGGWRASGERIQQVAEGIRRGVLPRGNL